MPRSPVTCALYPADDAAAAADSALLDLCALQCYLMQSFGTLSVEAWPKAKVSDAWHSISRAIFFFFFWRTCRGTALAGEGWLSFMRKRHGRKNIPNEARRSCSQEKGEDKENCEGQGFRNS